MFVEKAPQTENAKSCDYERQCGKCHEVIDPAAFTQEGK